jgi:hypothetical protein
MKKKKKDNSPTADTCCHFNVVAMAGTEGGVKQPMRKE